MPEVTKNLYKIKFLEIGRQCQWFHNGPGRASCCPLWFLRWTAQSKGRCAMFSKCWLNIFWLQSTGNEGWVRSSSGIQVPRLTGRQLDNYRKHSIVMGQPRSCLFIDRSAQRVSHVCKSVIWTPEWCNFRDILTIYVDNVRALFQMRLPW